ncbi:hypothetical protein [Dyadobacter bucti]|uniref:hypothetical protein n=1 Tax=Dyadobacter bucti TaxID=2572203 RepID=UPI003F6E9356
MKNRILLACVILICSKGVLMAQTEGKHFISGTAGINFNNINPSESETTNGYGYNFNIDIGKFRTANTATGWSLSNSLSGSKSSHSRVEGIPSTYNGINGFGFGLGRFWQFYKHFNTKFGLYAGPQLSLGYAFNKKYDDGGANNVRAEKDNTFTLAAGVSAGAYYQFTERWWITGSIGFSNPVSVEFSMVNSKHLSDQSTFKSKNLTYQFLPAITFPSVGLGLRYFLKNN